MLYGHDDVMSHIIWFVQRASACYLEVTTQSYRVAVQLLKGDKGNFKGTKQSHLHSTSAVNEK